VDEYGGEYNQYQTVEIQGLSYNSILGQWCVLWWECSIEAQSYYLLSHTGISSGHAVGSCHVRVNSWERCQLSLRQWQKKNDFNQYRYKPFED
jgi:hypothetical protein